MKLNSDALCESRSSCYCKDMSNTISINTLSNGLTVIVEQIDYLQSVSYSLSVPAGLISDTDQRVGASLILAELTSRGAGSYDARALSEAFDSHGIRHGEGAGLDAAYYSGSLLSDHLDQALRLVALMVQEPTLPENELDGIKSGLVQEIRGVLDNPARRVMTELAQRYFPEPFGRPSFGTLQGIEDSTIFELKQKYQSCYTPKNAILSIAGKVDTAKVLESVERYLAKWRAHDSGSDSGRPKFGAIKPATHDHIQSESAQLQIALIYPSARFIDQHYYAARVCNQILSGGMFGRLFIEVREKLGLCYSVYSSHSATANHGAVIVYAGTTPERAQETLDVTLRELKGVKGSVSDEELARAKANLKSALIISQEGAAARASSNLGDWYWLKSTRTLDQIAAEIDKVGKKQIDDYLEAYPVAQPTLLTLGSRALKL